VRTITEPSQSGRKEGNDTSLSPRKPLIVMAGSTGLEPATSGLTGHSGAARQPMPDTWRLLIRALAGLGRSNRDRLSAAAHGQDTDNRCDSAGRRERAKVRYRITYALAKLALRRRGARLAAEACEALYLL
jgi:hypothetical protein